MADRVLHQEPPLTGAERAEQIDPTTSIVVEYRYKRPSIGREWKQDTDAGDYGYAEYRGTADVREGRLDLSLPGRLDVVALTRVVLEEIARQASKP